MNKKKPELSNCPQVELVQVEYSFIYVIWFRRRQITESVGVVILLIAKDIVSPQPKKGNTVVIVFESESSFPNFFFPQCVNN